MPSAVNTAIGGSTNAPKPSERHRRGILVIELDRHPTGKSRVTTCRCSSTSNLRVNIWARISIARAVYPRSWPNSSQAGKIHEDCITANGKTIGENCKGKFSWDRNVIKEFKVRR
jgi:dihydroxy-acid dehydratase